MPVYVESVMANVEHFFDSYASEFDSIYGTEQSLLGRLINPIFRKSMRLRFEKTLSCCQPIQGKTVLDIGCGPGHYSVALGRRGARKVVGIDFAESMIEIATKKAAVLNLSETCHFVLEDIMDFGTDEEFDYAIVMGVMDYIATPERFINKVLTLTDGKALFSFPASGGLLAWQRKVRYRKRCPLFLYDVDQLHRLFDACAPDRYEIEKLSRDYFVTVTLK